MMKKIKYYASLALTMLSLSMAVTGCESDDNTYLVRETDKVTFSSNLQSSRKITLRCNGEWHTVVPEGSEWLSTSPMEGVGDGSFDWIDVIAADNRGAEREGTIFLECEGKRYPITVLQSDGRIIYSQVAVYGNLKEEAEADAQAIIKYTKSFGDETVTVRGEVIGDCEGITIGPAEVNLEKGGGQIEINIEGIPTKAGDIEIAMYVDDVQVGTAKTTVLAPDEKPIEDFPVRWIFADAKDATIATANKNKHPEWGTDHYWLADEGNGRIDLVEAPGKTATALNSIAYNDGHLYFKGLYYKDWILFTMPIKYFPKGKSIRFRGNMRGSGSASAFFMIEYSTDNENWTQAEGAVTNDFTIGTSEKTFTYHIQCGDGTSVADDKPGNFDYSFPIDQAISNGTLYIRLRSCCNARVNLSTTVTTTGGGSNRLMGLTEISLAE